MASGNEGNNDGSADSSKDPGLDKSFVGKFVSGWLSNTPLSKWFGKESSASVIRKRNEEDDEEELSSQPPSKRTKLPLETNNYNSVNSNHSKNHPNSPNHYVTAMPGPSGVKFNKFSNSFNSDTTKTVSDSFINEAVGDGTASSDSEEDSASEGYFPTTYKAGNIHKSDQNVDNTVHKNVKNDNKIMCSRSLLSSISEQNNSRTLFPERSTTSLTTTSTSMSLSSRRPTFDASTFGSPNFVDKTLSTKRILSSPFYCGNTTYGGASAYGRKLGQSSIEFHNSTIRNSVQVTPVKPKCGKDITSLSNTARRILTTLEQYSTPISEAKKIPIAQKISRKDGLLSRYTGANPYLLRDVSKKSYNRELQVPSIPELIKMKQKERLQTVTEKVRQIASNSKSTLNNKHNYELKTKDDTRKYVNKIKTTVSSVRQNKNQLTTNDTVPEVNLPQVQLEITTLPKFDVLLPPTTNENRNTIKPVIPVSTKSAKKFTFTSTSVTKNKKGQNKIDNDKYTFSKPLIIAENVKSIIAKNNFKFSDPLSKKPSNNTTSNSNSYNNNKADSSLNDNKIKNKSTFLKNNGENTSSTINNDLFDKFKPPDGTWKCTTCLVQNPSDKHKCIACETSKEILKNTLPSNTKSVNGSSTSLTCSSSTSLTTPVLGFEDKLKSLKSTWECTTCLIRNENNLTKCAACETPKTSNVTSNNNNNKIFEASFKMNATVETWECPTCLITNKMDKSRCEACETLKPNSAIKADSLPSTTPLVSSSLMNQFKPASGSWECPTCMLRNNSDISQCAACETINPNISSVSITHQISEVKKQSSLATNQLNNEQMKFNFSSFPSIIDTNSWKCKKCMLQNKNDLLKCISCNEPKHISGFGDAFKTKIDQWECSSCLVKNSKDIKECVCCGAINPNFNTSNNNKNNLENLIDINNKNHISTFNFGVNNANIPQFQFGIPSESKIISPSTNIQIIKDDDNKNTFIFGNTKSETTSNTFLFGIPNSSASVSSSSETTIKERENILNSVNNPSTSSLKPNDVLTEKKESDSVKLIQQSANTITTSLINSTVSKISTLNETDALSSKLEFKSNNDFSTNKNKDELFSNVKPTAQSTFLSASTTSTDLTTTTQTLPNSSGFVFGVKPAKAINENGLFSFTSPLKLSSTITTSSDVTNTPFPLNSTSKINDFSSNKPFGFGNNPNSIQKLTFSFNTNNNNNESVENKSELTVASTSEQPTTLFKFGSGSTNVVGSSTNNSDGFNFQLNATPKFNFTNCNNSEKTDAVLQQQTPFTSFGTGLQSAKNGTFNFGGTMPNKKAVFEFGASQANTVTSTTNNNNLNNMAQSQQSQINFAGVQPLASTSGFPYNGPIPNFNFKNNMSQTGGSQRKIRKALRRTTHR